MEYRKGDTVRYVKNVYGGGYNEVFSLGDVYQVVRVQGHCLWVKVPGVGTKLLYYSEVEKEEEQLSIEDFM